MPEWNGNPSVINLMLSEEIRKSFIEFFKNKGHVIVPSSSLISDDSSVLLTTAGMQQFKRYYTGELNPMKDFGSQRTISIQKCFRTSDIDSVGDESHLTFFEMLGNFSFGPVGSDNPLNNGKDGYFKKSAINWGFEFLNKESKIDVNRLSVSIFKGDEKTPFDDESFKIVKELGFSDEKIIRGDRKDNFWGPTGMTGPCGPTVEFYIDGLEVWNLVFNEYFKDEEGLRKLDNPGVDTGMGFERLVAVMQNKKSVYDTDIFERIINEVKKLMFKVENSTLNDRAERIIADHVRSAVFMITDGIIPSNVERGYVLRRLIRRAIRHAKLSGLKDGVCEKVAKIVIKENINVYPDLIVKEDLILAELVREEQRFNETLEKGLVITKKIFNKKESITKDKFVSVMESPEKRDFFISYLRGNFNAANKYEITKAELDKAVITGKEAFDLFQSYGFPLEMIDEIATEERLIVDHFGFRKELERHQKLSKAGSEQKFKGGLAGTGEMETKYHTATHLLLASLRKVLSGEIVQKGSNITAERMRFDFNWPEKVPADKLKEVEDLVNQKIQEKIPVELMELPKEEAKKIVTTLSFDLSKYGDVVKVYKIGDFSAEFCGGPHVSNTGVLGHFKIIKEEASSQGVRRIKATIN